LRVGNVMGLRHARKAVLCEQSADRVMVGHDEEIVFLQLVSMFRAKHNRIITHGV